MAAYSEFCVFCFPYITAVMLCCGEAVLVEYSNTQVVSINLTSSRNPRPKISQEWQHVPSAFFLQVEKYKVCLFFRKCTFVM